MTRIKVRRGTSAQWNAANPVLAEGELGFETDTVRLKIGNGTAVWTTLAYTSIDISVDWTTLADKPAVIAAGATKADARSAIDAENTANRGVANGYAALDAAGLVPLAQIPPGADGADGADGAPGPPGADGATGPPGPSTVADDVLTIQNSTDATKQAKFSASAIATGTTRTYTLPNATTTLVGTDTTATLTNKTLTEPRIGGSLRTTGDAVSLTFSQNGSGTPVNFLRIQNAVTGFAPNIAADGTDENVDISVQPKGTGRVTYWAGSQSAAVLNANGGATDVNWNLTTRGAGTVQANGVPVLTTSGNQTLTNKILTNPRIGVIHDLNGNTGVWIGGTASAVNFLQISNAASDGRPVLRAQGETNVDLGLVPRGTGSVVLQDGNFAIVMATNPTPGGTNHLLVGNSLTGNAPFILASGNDVNINLNLRTKGTGAVQANGVAVLTATDRGQAGGVASLDAGGLVPPTQLPSYVDDVLEFANLAAFPATGETGKIYIAADTSKSWRWTGSVYAEIIASPGSTDGVIEGSTNLYFTNARADSRISAAVGVSVQPFDSDLSAFAAKTAPAGAVVGTTDSQSLSDKTLLNPTISGYTESVVASGVVTSAATLSLANGTVLTATLTANTACSFTMPAVAAGKSFVLMLRQAPTTGNGTATFSGVRWAAAGAPVVTATAGRMDIISFFSDGTNWYGTAAQGFTP